MTYLRVPLVRVLADGTVTDGTARFELRSTGPVFGDVRDLDGVPLDLPAGARYELDVDALPIGGDDS